MINETIDLYRHFHVAREGAKEGLLTAYVPQFCEEIESRLRPAIIVIAGGGYEFRSKREGEPVALSFVQRGYAAFVLDYDIFTAYPVPLLQACMAVKYLRENAAKYGIDKEHICAVGFSAGGHLTGMLGTMYGRKEICSALHASPQELRPDAVVLSYAVLTMGELTHEGTRRVITGGDEALYDDLSIEKNITKESAPAFLWHTVSDDCVPVENSLMAAASYRKCGVPFELHLFEHGRHGLSLCNYETGNFSPEDMPEEVGVWITLACTWLKNRGFAVKKA